MDRDFLIAQRNRPLVLLLGGNLGNREKYLQEAVRRLKEAFGESVGISDVYETEPWGLKEQNSFMNQAVIFESNQKPTVLLDTVLNIEREVGRVRDIKWGPRVIDIDIIFHGELVYQSEILEIPHPYMQERLFVLEPLNEIIPDFEHPVLNKTITQLLEHQLSKEANDGK